MILSKGREPKKQALLEALAKEDLQILGLAYAHAKYLTMYGVDIEKTIATATENVEELTRAYQKGYYDAMERISRMERFEAERDEVRTCANCKHYKHFGKEFPCIDCMMDCKDRFEESEDKE